MYALPIIMEFIIIRIYQKDQVAVLRFYLFCLGAIFFLIYFPSNKQQTAVQSLENKYPWFFCHWKNMWILIP